MYIGDLHIHSRYSRATSKELRRSIWTYGREKRELTL